MTEFYIVLVAFFAALGGMIVFFLRSARWKWQAEELKNKLELEQKEKLLNATELVEIQKNLEDIKEKYFIMKAKFEAAELNAESMKETFQALAHQTLEGQSKQFLNLAEQTFEKHTKMAKGDLELRQQSIDHIVAPLKLSLEALQKHTHELEKERQTSYSNLSGELKRVAETSHSLSSETRALKDALKKPHIRGRWGEVQLKNCVDLAGMSEYSDVTFQDMNIDDDGQKLIPDLTVRMPGGRVVVVDAKTPLDAFIASLESTTEEGRSLEMHRHGQQVKDHVKKLSQKSYGENLKESADFTVLFLPNESFLYAALETQPDLVEFALEKKILIATPPTFIGLLKVIRYGWSEERLAMNAEKIRDVGRELHKRAVEFVDTYVSVGKYLSLATDKYEEGLKRLNNRLILQARKMEELGAQSAKELPESMGFEAPTETND
jgi:DNA recombination protein RmuC